MSNMVSKHQIDVEGLNKGDYIDANELETMFGTKRTESEYGLKVLQLKSSIEKECEKRNYPVTTRIEEYGIRILTDAEATVYNNQRFKTALTHAFVAHYKQQTVDQEELNDFEKEQHVRRLVNQSRFLQAINKVRMEIQYKPHERITPTSLSAMSPDEAKKEIEDTKRMELEESSEKEIVEESAVETNVVEEKEKEGEEVEIV